MPSSRRAGFSTVRAFPRVTTSDASSSSCPTSKRPPDRSTPPCTRTSAYDIVPGEFQIVDQPDIVLVEGLNVLQTGQGVFVSDFFDFSIYLDADEEDIERWYVERFLALRETVLPEPAIVPFIGTPASAKPTRSRPAAASGSASTASTCARTWHRRASGPASCSRREGTTASGGCGCDGRLVRGPSRGSEPVRRPQA